MLEINHIEGDRDFKESSAYITYEVYKDDQVYVVIFDIEPTYMWTFLSTLEHGDWEPRDKHSHKDIVEHCFNHMRYINKSTRVKLATMGINNW